MTWPSFDVRELAWAAGIVAPRHYKAKAWRHNWLCLAAKKSCKILNIPLQICQKLTQKLMLQSNSYIVLDPCNLHACSPPLDLTIKDVQRGGPAPFCPNGQSKRVLHCQPPRRKANLEPITLKKSILPLIQQFWNSSQHNGFALNPKSQENLCNPSQLNPNELCKPRQKSNQNRRRPNKWLKSNRSSDDDDDFPFQKRSV